MDLDSLKDKIRAAQLHPIHVRHLDNDSPHRHPFIGSIEEYLDAVKALSSPIVLIQTFTLDEDEFFHEPPDIEGGDAEAPASLGEQERDLRDVESGLRAYERYIGETSAYLLSSALGTPSLGYLITEEWWTEFRELADKASDYLDGEHHQSAAQRQAEKEAGDQAILDSLNSLLRDSRFVDLKTQRAMMEYAFDKIPGLEKLDDSMVRVAIQRLHGKIKARGLDRKR